MPRRKARVLVALVLIVIASSALAVRTEQARGFAPREPTMAEDTYAISLEEAMTRRYNFSFWLPSGIPENYHWTSVIFSGVTPDVSDSLKKTFVADRVFLLYSTHPLNMSMTLTEFRSKYSTILVNEASATGGNTSTGGNPTYLEGYPASIKPNSIYLFKFDEHTVYTVTTSAAFSQEQLLTIAKSLITRPYKIQVETSTQTITSTSTYATMTTTTTTTTQTETTTEPTIYAWAIAATTVATLLAIILLRRKSKSDI